MNFIFKINIIITSIFYFTTINSQEFDSQFDSLIILQPDRMLDQNISRHKIIIWNNLMLEKAKKNHYQKGIIWAKINLGKQYYNLSKPDISLKYLNEALLLADATNADNVIYAKIYNEFSQVYYTLGLYDLSLQYNSKAMNYGKKIKNSSYKNLILSKVYAVRATNLILSKKDSVLYYLHKSVKTSEHPLVYAYLGDYYTDRNTHLDSAKIYLNRAQIIYHKNKTNNKYILSNLYYFYGKVYYKEKNYRKAVKYLEKSLLYASSGKNRQHLLRLNDLLALIYRQIGDLDNERKILEDYKKFNDFYKDSQAKSIQITLQSFEKNLFKREDNRINKITFYTFILVIAICLLLFFHFKRNKKTAIRKENILIEKYKNSLENIAKSTTDLDALYKSAKTRDPNFYTKFQNVYPNFFKNILEINSSIQKNELHLLAYIYLNFETKEIADILFLSPKTIQNKKHNIRKKLNIHSSEDLYIWLKSSFK